MATILFMTGSVSYWWFPGDRREELCSGRREELCSGRREELCSGRRNEMCNNFAPNLRWPDL